MPVEATYIGGELPHPYLHPGTRGSLYDHTDEETAPRILEGELWFVPEHRDSDTRLNVFYTVSEEEVRRD